MPPQVPPKPFRRNSFAVSVGDDGGYNLEDPMRSAYEDSTIGREHSVLPMGLRPNRSDNNNNMDGISGAYEGSSNRSNNENKSERRQSVTMLRSATPSRIEPDLVGKDR